MQLILMDHLSQEGLKFWTWGASICFPVCLSHCKRISRRTGIANFNLELQQRIKLIIGWHGFQSNTIYVTWQ